VRKTRSPSRRKTSSAKYSLVPHAFWKASPIAVYHGSVQPIRRLSCSICGWGAHETNANVVARVEVGQVADLVSEHRAAAARPVVRRQPEVVDDLAAPLEEVGQLEDPVGPFEGVI
jgi:hypothetical protein